jgi:hypothetical protein
VLVNLSQPGEEVGHILRADVLNLGPPGCGQGCRIALQVTPIGLERVLGEAPFNGQVVEIAPDGSGERRQLSTSTRAASGRP